MIETGDHFIYKSKYGGITEGIIGKIIESKGINTATGYIHRKFTIQSTNNISYYLDEIELVERKASDEEIERFKKITEAVNNFHQKRKAQFEETVKKHTNESNKERC
jgi:hypothetical protein